LWGRSATGAVLPVDEVAQASGTIAYELLCALAPRVPVTVVDESAVAGDGQAA
jgi:alanine racemase